MERDTLRIATRGSDLALWQANHVGRLAGRPYELVIVKTTGDVLRDAPLQGQSTIGFFTREIEKALEDCFADLAVHSLKDLPVEQPAGLELAAILERHDACDVLLVHPDCHDRSLPLPVGRGSRVGAGSLRRKSALESARPDLEPVLVRGNVPTRVRKVADRQVDALVGARAGLARLGLGIEPLLAFDLDPAAWIPAPGQAAIAVEVRRSDAWAARAVAALDHAPTRECVELERRLLAMAGGGCHAPFAAWARRSARSPDGGPSVFDVEVGAPGRDCPWARRSFGGESAQVEREARRWFDDGCPMEGGRLPEVTCSPALPWC